VVPFFFASCSLAAPLPPAAPAAPCSSLPVLLSPHCSDLLKGKKRKEKELEFSKEAISLMKKKEGGERA